MRKNDYMETKQHATKKQWVNKEIKMEIKKYLQEINSVLCDHLEGWDSEGGRETQEGGDMGIYVYV